MTLCDCWNSMESGKEEDNVTLPAVVGDWQQAPARDGPRGSSIQVAARDGPRGSSIQVVLDAHESHDLRVLHRLRITILSLVASHPPHRVAHRAIDAWLSTRLDAEWLSDAVDLRCQWRSRITARWAVSCSPAWAMMR